MNDDARLMRWQTATAAALLVGYAGFYICRSNLSVAVPALVADPAAGVDRTAIGAITSAGVVAYAAGKLVNGIAGDFVGGKALFLAALFLSVAATVAFGASSGAPLFTLIWVVNRFVQSAGWGGLTKTAAHWYPATRYGAVMSLLSLSYLFGDAAGRFLLGTLMSAGLDWRSVFFVSAGVLCAIGVVNLFVLKGSPGDVGLPEPAVSTSNIFGTGGSASRPANVIELLKPYATSTSFWLICGLSFGMTLIREAFNAWIPVYLVDAHQLAPGIAAQYSALFPLVGGVSCIVFGVVTDRTPGNRVVLMVPALTLCAVSLWILALATARHDVGLSLLAIGATALFLLGPYTLLAGAIALDLGGRKGSATAAGLIDTAGYLGGTLSGFGIGKFAEAGGWSAAFNLMAALAAGVVAIALAYCFERRWRVVWRAPRHPETT